MGAYGWIGGYPIGQPAGNMDTLSYANRSTWQ
jgi:hypothetical protein